MIFHPSTSAQIFQIYFKIGLITFPDDSQVKHRSYVSNPIGLHIEKCYMQIHF